MDAQAVAERLDKVQLVDVRQAGEWDAGHIEGAVHIPEEDLAERSGFDAQSLDKGLLSWKWAGLPLTGRIAEPDTSPEDQSPELALHDELIAVTSALKDRFGDREPTEEELHVFLRERLIDEGRTPEEADTFLAEMGDG